MPNMKLRITAKPTLLALALLSMVGATPPPGRSVRDVVDATIPALMAKDGIPGMAVAVAVKEASIPAREIFESP